MESMVIEMRRVIVTGANGFVGSVLTKELSKRGIETLAVVRNAASDIESIQGLPNVKIVYCELNNISNLPQKILDRGVDTFFHFAWSGTSGDSRGDINRQLANVKAACEAVTVAKSLGCNTFVNACSIMEYEAMQYVPMDSSAPGIGTIYAAAKQSADFMSKILAVKLGITYKAVIISNIYGPGEKSARFVNTILKKMIKNEPIQLTDGTQLYDFIYIDDAVEAILKVAEGKSIYNESVYIGNSEQRPLREFVLKMKETINSKSKLCFGAVKYNGALLTYREFNVKKLEKKLKFHPKVSFYSGIQNTKKWIASNMDMCQNFEKKETVMEGVYFFTPFYRADKRGSFLKSIEKDIFKDMGMEIDVQEDFESYSKKNVIRGIHFQTKNPQIKLVRAIKGKVMDVIVDLRRGSQTFGKSHSFILSDKNHYTLWIPAGFAHGFRVLSEEGAIMSYKCIGKYEKGFDSGIVWNDKDLAIDWGIDCPILSERDANQQTFRDFIKLYGSL